MIGFNKPYFTGKELDYIFQAIRQEKISGNGEFTKNCQDLLSNELKINVAMSVILVSSLNAGQPLYSLKP